MNKRQENYLKKTQIKVNFRYNEELLNQAHKIIKNDKNIKVWNLTKIVSHEITILYNLFSKAKNETIKNQFNLWKQVRYKANGSEYPFALKKSSVKLSKYQANKYNEILNYFNAKYKTPIRQIELNNYIINRFLIDLIKDYKNNGNKYLKYLKKKQQYDYKKINK